MAAGKQLSCSLAVAALAVIGMAGAGCDEPTRPGLERAVIAGRIFWLEPALDEPTRVKGLGGRDSIPEDGGMLFVFPHAQVLLFVMRDCRFDIDIAYLDDAGRVLAIHTMTVEPRHPGESDIAYEQRLKRYSSRYPARFAVEVRGGTLDALNVRPGDLVHLDLEGLKRRVR